MMEIHERYSLKEKTTLKVGGSARYFIDTDDLESAVSFAKEKDLPVFVLGGGSNIVLPDGEIDAVVISPKFLGTSVLEESDESVLVKVGGSEVLDNFIQHTVDKGWWGLENLSWIPGLVAGLAVQNVGAYGVEASSYIERVHIFDTKDGVYGVLDNKECSFGYRKSIFNTKKKGRYIITHVELRLSKTEHPILTYRGLQDRVGEVSQKNIRDTVITIRKEKDLDPERVFSVGSFFKNVEVKDISFLPEEVQKKCFEMESGYKIPAGALIEHVGLKGFCINDACVSSVQANMLINKGNASSEDIKNIYQHVVERVRFNLNVELVHEPEFV
ncbi:MAG: UDP-N-acetylmuramate dehydrogenase [Patescibacteria group bacterium UBA2103]